MAQMATPNHRNDIWDVFFKDRRWLDRARKDKVIPLLIGAPEDTDDTKEAYFVLLLVTDDGSYPFFYIVETRRLFYECLNDHQEDGKKQLQFNNVTLNTDAFYNLRKNSADIERIARPKPPADGVAPVMVDSTAIIAFEDENKVGKLMVGYFEHEHTFLILLEVSGNNLIWVFESFNTALLD